MQQYHTSLDMPYTWDHQVHPYPLRQGAQDPLLCSSIEDVPDLTYSPTESSDSLGEDSHELDLAFEYAHGVDCPSVTLDDNAAWASFRESLRVDKPGILEQAEASKKDLFEHSNSANRTKRPRAGRHSSARSRRTVMHDADDDTSSDYSPSPTAKRSKYLRRSPAVKNPQPASPTQLPRVAKGQAVRQNVTNRRGRARNIQASAEEQERLRAAVDEGIPTDGICTYCQRRVSKRAPDLRRHMRTHLPAEIRCIGVPLKKTCLEDIPAGATPYLHEGQAYIGGCMKLFSRKDALKRHLDNANTVCISKKSV